MLWGFGHFMIYMLYDLNLNVIKLKLPKLISIIITFISVSLLWIPFRSNSLYEAFYIFKNIFNFNFLSIPFGLFTLVKILGLIILLFAVDILIEKNIKIVYNKFILAFIICLIIFLANFYSNNFIYFQF